MTRKSAWLSARCGARAAKSKAPPGAVAVRVESQRAVVRVVDDAVVGTVRRRADDIARGVQVRLEDEAVPASAAGKRVVASSADQAIVSEPAGDGARGRADSVEDIIAVAEKDIALDPAVVGDDVTRDLIAGQYQHAWRDGPGLAVPEDGDSRVAVDEPIGVLGLERRHDDLLLPPGRRRESRRTVRNRLGTCDRVADAPPTRRGSPLRHSIGGGVAAVVGRGSAGPG